MREVADAVQSLAPALDAQLAATDPRLTRARKTFDLASLLQGRHRQPDRRAQRRSPCSCSNNRSRSCARTTASRRSTSTNARQRIARPQSCPAEDNPPSSPLPFPRPPRQLPERPGENAAADIGSNDKAAAGHCHPSQRSHPVKLVAISSSCCTWLLCALARDATNALRAGQRGHGDATDWAAPWSASRSTTA